MILPKERIAKACDLGPVEGVELLGRARAGNAGALEDWLVYAVMAKLRRSSPSREVAKQRTIEMMSYVDVVARSNE